MFECLHMAFAAALAEDVNTRGKLTAHTMNIYDWKYMFLRTLRVHLGCLTPCRDRHASL